MKFSKFFTNLQEAPWYRSFLNPVIKEINTKGKLLDIGTGSGKLIQILATEKGMDCIGVDTDLEMLEEAKNKLRNVKAGLLKISPNAKLPFENNSFEYVTICNVLFHLNKKDMDYMLKDSLRLLNDEGKIIVLTPTGKSNFLKLTKYYFSIENRGIYVWYCATKNRARLWMNENYLAKYASKHGLKYKKGIIMNGFAQLETITK